jgi:hypothetical protein
MQLEKAGPSAGACARSARTGLHQLPVEAPPNRSTSVESRQLQAESTKRRPQRRKGCVDQPIRVRGRTVINAFVQSPDMPISAARVRPKLVHTTSTRICGQMQSDEYRRQCVTGQLGTMSAGKVWAAFGGEGGGAFWAEAHSGWRHARHCSELRVANLLAIHDTQRQQDQVAKTGSKTGLAGCSDPF